MNGLPFTVVGVYAEKDPDSQWSMDNIIVFPYTASRLLSPGTQMNEFVVKAASAQASVEVSSRLSGFLTGLTNNGKSGSGYVDNSNQWQQNINEQATMMSLVLGGIAAISLLVGGIGIMNIMLVSVTERTREIGIRKAVGAKRRHIMLQFLCEACILSVLGGIIGLLLSFSVVEIYSLISATSVGMNWGVGIAAIAFCAVIGVLFGGYPAAKASRLQPIDALHTL